MTVRKGLAIVVLGDNHYKIAFDNHVAIYDKKGRLQTVVNPTDEVVFPAKLKILEFRNGAKPQIDCLNLPSGIFI